MKFYRLSANSFQWHAVLERNKLHKVVVPINKDEFIVKENYPIKMELVDAYNNIKEWKEETPFVDIIRWSNDFTIGGNQPEKAALLIINKRLKQVLEKYRLPLHRFYPVQMYCKYTKEKKDNYFLFHMIGDGVYGDENVYYEKCTFEEYTRDEDDEKVFVRKYPEGIIKSSKDYIDVKMNRSEKIALGSYEDIDIPGDMYTNDFNYIDKVFKYNYDVLWGTPNVIYVSEEIKNELVALNCTNALFIEVPYNMVRPFEYKKEL
ncbi:hypothetical protein [Tenacibaculum aiptasiae]|uniref:hypothetical protein n=1 Tax=Tenacibaculum aiptasiae TaxID=426481 RepID=UPI003B5AE4CC